jgi:glycosyltransferase involved in cell wall biosynthesis
MTPRAQPDTAKATTIVCAIAYNEEEFAPGFLESARRLGGTILVGDTGSTDGTARCLRAGGARVIDIPRALFLLAGFGQTRNWVLDRVPREVRWVHWLDLDERVDGPAAVPRRAPFGDVTTRTYARDRRASVARWQRALALPFTDEGHTRVHRNLRTVRWAGLVHEELWNSWHRREKLPIIHHHLARFRGREQAAATRNLYAFMLWRALKEPSLRRGTNPWWFTERVRALGAAGLALEREHARRSYAENRHCLPDLAIDWSPPAPAD